jgi:60 kDa SS-A/Ro ribonucleoprotein
MANKSVFSNRGVSTVKVADAVNEAGGRAYSRDDEQVLAQYIVTGCLNGTFYANADEQVDTILEKAKNCDVDFVAKAAVYARKVAKMKDTPALLAATLTTRGVDGLEYLNKIFGMVIDNQKQLRNFVQIMRSGKVGRKSFGTAVKRLIQDWLRNQKGDQLFYQSVGNDPSLADIVKMVHVHPANKEQEAFFGWLLSKQYNKRYLPKLLKAFEAYKAAPEKNEVPAVDFRMLTALSLGKEQWTAIAINASWNTLRMNLNTFQRHGVYEDKAVVQALAAKLANEDEVRKHNVFPYQLLTAYQNIDSAVPVQLRNALQDAMECATANVPTFNGRTAVCVDTSGSMSSPITGHRTGATTTTSCVDVAGLVAATIVRKNEDAIVVPFDTEVHMVDFNSRDSVMTNAKKFARNGGGTACHVALNYLTQQMEKVDTVIFVSDNESWFGNSPASGYFGYYSNRGSQTAIAWKEYQNKVNRKAKLICIDIQPNRTVQVPDDKAVLNIGGFTDSVFEVVANFVNGDSRDFVKTICDSVEL